MDGEQRVDVRPVGRWSMNRKVVPFLIALAFLPAGLFAETALEAGEKLFADNKPEEARVKLEEALVQDSKNEKVYYDLGIVYQQLKNYPKAIEVLQRGLPVATSLKALLLFEIGVCYDEKGLADYTLADKFYTQALEENSVFAAAYLNRGLVRLRAKQYQETINDCTTYLKVYPDTPKRKEVEALIAALRSDVENQAKLLDSILNSLKNASAGTHTNAAGTEDFKDAGTDGGDILD
jgi:tetratricopeptide (TPR) repeat protein